MSFLNHLISGISLGSIYAIIALGYTMVYGIAKMLNFAHGDVIMVGGYMCFCATTYLGWPAWMGVVLAVIVCTVLGMAIERLAYKMRRCWSGPPTRRVSARSSAAARSACSAVSSRSPASPS